MSMLFEISKLFCFSWENDNIGKNNNTNNKKAKMEAYSILWANLHVDATDEYLNKFKNCFSRFVGDQCPILFAVDEED